MATILRPKTGAGSEGTSRPDRHMFRIPGHWGFAVCVRWLGSQALVKTACHRPALSSLTRPTTYPCCRYNHEHPTSSLVSGLLPCQRCLWSPANERYYQALGSPQNRHAESPRIAVEPHQALHFSSQLARFARQTLGRHRAAVPVDRRAHISATGATSAAVFLQEQHDHLNPAPGPGPVGEQRLESRPCVENRPSNDPSCTRLLHTHAPPQGTAHPRRTRPASQTPTGLPKPSDWRWPTGASQKRWSPACPPPSPRKQPAHRCAMDDHTPPAPAFAPTPPQEAAHTTRGCLRTQRRMRQPRSPPAHFTRRQTHRRAPQAM